MGHDMEGMTAEEHASMQGQDLPANAAPREPFPVVTDADRAAAFPDVAGHTVHDDGVHWYSPCSTGSKPGTRTKAARSAGKARLDRYATWTAAGCAARASAIDDQRESADVEVLYGRSGRPLVGRGSRRPPRLRRGPSQTFAALGVMGLAPYKFEVSATAYLGESGQLGAKVEAEYETLFTNRLILQWLVEAEAWGKDDPRRGIGSG